VSNREFSKVGTVAAVKNRFSATPQHHNTYCSTTTRHQTASEINEM
jgi:hypothetical protein